MIIFTDPIAENLGGEEWDVVRHRPVALHFANPIANHQ